MCYNLCRRCGAAHSTRSSKQARPPPSLLGRSDQGLSHPLSIVQTHTCVGLITINLGVAGPLANAEADYRGGHQGGRGGGSFTSSSFNSTRLVHRRYCVKQESLLIHG